MTEMMTETDDLILDEVQELTWAMIDDCATEKDVQRLERLLLDHETARKTYVSCIQLHVDLQFLLGGKRLPLPKLPPHPSKKSTKSSGENSKGGAALPLVDLSSSHCDMPMMNSFLP
jgi:hypothetical protein